MPAGNSNQFATLWSSRMLTSSTNLIYLWIVDLWRICQVDPSQPILEKEIRKYVFNTYISNIIQSALTFFVQRQRDSGLQQTFQRNFYCIKDISSLSLSLSLSLSCSLLNHYDLLHFLPSFFAQLFATSILSPCLVLSSLVALLFSASCGSLIINNIHYALKAFTMRVVLYYFAFKKQNKSVTGKNL